MNWPTTPSGSSYYYELPAGNYYLASDVTTSFTKITGEVNLCLNGHTLNTGAGSAGIQVAGEDAVLNLCDCGTRGTVTGASKSAMADIAEVEVENKASFSLYGGTVHNTADGGVAQGVSTLSGTLNLYGGTVISDCDNAVWFDRWQAVALHISGGPVLRGAADKADVILYTFGSSSKTVTLDGPLTAAQPYRVAVQGAKPFTTGWSGHMDGADFSDYFVSATKGLFFEENGGELMFSEYAITGQPTAENGYTVTANGAPACAPAGYQWYPAKVTTEAVTDRNATGYSGGSGYGTGSYDSEAGVWKCEGSYVMEPRYFTIHLSKGAVVTVSLSAPLGRNMRLQLYPQPYNYDYLVQTDEVNGNGEYVLTAPAEGDYIFMIDNMYGEPFTQPTLTAKVTEAKLGAAVSGQTTAKLTAATAGIYLCRVTWADGTALNTDLVSYTPATSEHTHVWDTAWTKHANHHWHECTADGCGVEEDSEKNSYGPHTWNDGVVTTQPTVDAEGIKTYTCTDCQATKTEAIPKLSFDISGTVTDHEDNAVKQAEVKPCGAAVRSAKA